MLKNLSEKYGAKFPATTLSHSMVKIACLDDAFSEIFKLETNPVEVNHCCKKIRKGEKGKVKKKKLKNKKPKDVGHFPVLKILISVHARTKMS